MVRDVVAWPRFLAHVCVRAKKYRGCVVRSVDPISAARFFILNRSHDVFEHESLSDFRFGISFIVVEFEQVEEEKRGFMGIKIVYVHSNPSFNSLCAYDRYTGTA